MLTKPQVDAIQADLLAAETAIVNTVEAAIITANTEGASSGAIARIEAAWTASKVTLAALHRAFTAAAVELGVTPDPAPSPLSGGGDKD